MEIVMGKRPSRPSKEMGAHGLDGSIWDLVEDCWRQDPAERLSAGQIVDKFRLERDDVFTLAPEWDNTFVQEIRCNLEDHMFHPPTL